MLQPLDRVERERVIRRVLDELESSYGDRLLYVAAYGSDARDAVTPYSDIDLLAIVKKGPAGEHDWLYHTTPVGVHVRPLRAVRERILRVDGFWPHEVSMLLAHRVLLDRQDIGTRLRRWHEEALKGSSPVESYAGFYEWFSKMLRGWETRHPETIRRVAWEFQFMFCMELALLNKRFFTNQTGMLDEVEGFDYVPEGFMELARNLMAEDMGTVFEAAKGLFELHRKVADEQGFAMPSLTSIDEIRIDG